MESEQPGGAVGCTECGADAPQRARFCARCGVPIAAGDASESRRVVSVVFCDLVGSTSLSERLDPEALRALVGRYFRRMRVALERFGGEVEKFIGDAVVGVFGVPELHEDDALQAVRAAVAMRREAAELHRELSAMHGIELAVRIGVNTGEVMVSGEGTNARVTGEMVNVAARLQQAAEPGQIVIGAATRDLVRGAVRLEPLVPLRLKGKSTVVPAWAVLGVDQEAPGIQRRMTAPLIAREDELRFLRGNFEHISARRMASVVTVYGEPGIGKSRLAHEFLDWVKPQARVCVRRCPPFGPEASLGPLLGMLATVARESQLSPALQEAVRALSDGVIEHTADDVLWVARRTFEAAAALRPLVLVLDDVHWAKPLLLDVIGQLADALRGVPVMLLCLARLDLLDIRPAWSGGKLFAASVLLAPLDRRAAERLVRSQFEVTLHDPRSDAAVTVIAERSGGNPLYIEQIVSAVSDGATIEALPLTIRALLAARLQALTSEEVRIMQWAAVYGTECSAELLGVLAGIDEVRQLLDGLTHRQLIEPSGGDGYRFRNVQIREVAHEGIPKRTRARMHHRISELLAEIRGDAAAGEIAAHLEQALGYLSELGEQEAAGNLRAPAARALRVAAGHELLHGDLHGSADWLRRAIAVAAPDDPTRSAMLTELATTLLSTARIDEARATFDEAAAVAGRHGDPVAAAHARLDRVQLPGPAPNTGELLRTAADAIPVFTEVSDARGLGKAYALRGQAYAAEGRYLRAVEAFGDSRTWAAAASDELLRAQTIGGLAFSLWRGPTPAPEAMAQCEALLDSLPGSRRLARVGALCPLAVLLAARSRMAEADALLDEAEHLVADFAHEYARISVSMFVASVRTMAGELPVAEQRLRSTCEALAELGGGIQHAAARGELIRVLLAAGEVEQAVALLYAQPEPDGEADFPAGWFGVRARAQCAAGEFAAAQASAGTALRLAFGTDSPEIQAVALLDQAQVHRALGRADHARRAAEREVERYRAKGHLVGLAEALRCAEPGAVS